jgi:hypothetical protein
MLPIATVNAKIIPGNLCPDNRTHHDWHYIDDGRNQNGEEKGSRDEPHLTVRGRRLGIAIVTTLG